MVQPASDGAAGKTLYVAAAETRLDRCPKRLELLAGNGSSNAEVAELARSSFAAGDNVVSDGLACWHATAAASCAHLPTISSHGKKPARWASFNWVDTAFGSIETAPAGIGHHVRARHTRRFSCRFQRDTMSERRTWAALQAGPRPHRLVAAG